MGMHLGMYAEKIHSIRDVIKPQNECYHTTISVERNERNFFYQNKSSKSITEILFLVNLTEEKSVYSGAVPIRKYSSHSLAQLCWLNNCCTYLTT